MYAVSIGREDFTHANHMEVHGHHKAIYYGLLAPPA